MQVHWQITVILLRSHCCAALADVERCPTQYHIDLVTCTNGMYSSVLNIIQTPRMCDLYSTIALLQRVISATTRLVYDPHHRCYDWAALATNPCLDTVQAVSCSSTWHPLSSHQLQQLVTTRYPSLWSASNNALLVPQTSLKWRANIQCCWTCSLELPSNGHPDIQHHSSFEEETENFFVYQILWNYRTLDFLFCILLHFTC